MEHQVIAAAERPMPEDGKAPELDAAAFAAEQTLKACLGYQVEFMRFLERRTYANLEFMRRLPHCRGFDEVAGLQQAWLKSLMADYGEEIGRLAGTGLQLATGELVPLQWLLYRRGRAGRVSIAAAW